jgi:hypothetical protein
MSAIISSKNLDDFCMLSNRAVSLMSKWFAANKLTLNLDKTDIIKFITYNSPQFMIGIGYEDKYIEESVHTKFLGLQIESHFELENPCQSAGPKVKRCMLCSKIPVTYQQH